MNQIRTWESIWKLFSFAWWWRCACPPRLSVVRTFRFWCAVSGLQLHISLLCISWYSRNASCGIVGEVEQVSMALIEYSCRLVISVTDTQLQAWWSVIKTTLWCRGCRANGLPSSHFSWATSSSPFSNCDWLQSNIHFAFPQIVDSNLDREFLPLIIGKYKNEINFAFGMSLSQAPCVIQALCKKNMSIKKCSTFDFRFNKFTVSNFRTFNFQCKP